MNQQELIQFNKKIINSIKSTKKETVLDKNAIDLKSIKRFISKEWFQSNLSNLCRFLQKVDNKHPELPIFLTENLGPDFIELCENITILNSTIDSKCQLLNSLKSKINKSVMDLFDFNFLKSINDPSVTKTQVRFLNYAKRWDVRATKQHQQIFKKTTSRSHVLNLENGIQCFSHNSGGVERLYEQLTNRKKHFDDLNCHNMSKEISMSLEKISENLASKKYGFYRTSISSLINIISNVHDFDYAEICPLADPQVCMENEKYICIKLCESFFGKNHGIFDHYAEIKFSNFSHSYLVGEIDQKTYFMGIVV